MAGKDDIESVYLTDYDRCLYCLVYTVRGVKTPVGLLPLCGDHRKAEIVQSIVDKRSSL